MISPRSLGYVRHPGLGYNKVVHTEMHQFHSSLGTIVGQVSINQLTLFEFQSCRVDKKSATLSLVPSNELLAKSWGMA